MSEKLDTMDVIDTMIQAVDNDENTVTGMSTADFKEQVNSKLDKVAAENGYSSFSSMVKPTGNFAGNEAKNRIISDRLKGLLSLTGHSEVQDVIEEVIKLLETVPSEEIEKLLKKEVKRIKGQPVSQRVEGRLEGIQAIIKVFEETTDELMALLNEELKKAFSDM